MSSKVKHKLKKRPFLTVYTVISSDETPRFSMVPLTIGSFVSRGKAIRACADYILERMERVSDIRRAVYLDEHHKELRDKIKKEFNAEWVERVLLYEDGDFSWNKDEMRQDLKKFLFDCFVDEIGGESCYRIRADFWGADERGIYQFNFDVDENDVEGTMEAWTCITSGSSDCEDEGFTQPFPEVFLSEKEALKCALDDLRGYLEDGEPQYIRDIVKEAKDSFDRFGKFCYDLNDGVMRRWDVWYTPIVLSGDIPEECPTRRKKGKD